MFETNSDSYVIEAAVAPGTPLVVELPTSGPFAWSVYPAEGATVVVEFSTSSRTRLAAGTARFRSYGTISAPGGDESAIPYTALRFTAAGGTATIEVIQK